MHNSAIFQSKDCNREFLAKVKEDFAQAISPPFSALFFVKFIQMSFKRYTIDIKM